MLVSVIVPVWNGGAVVRQCLEAVFASSAPIPRGQQHTLELIAVDNASADDSAGLIAREFSAVRLLRQPFNLGFAGGANVGLGAATGDLLVLLNQDCLPRPGWVEALANALDADRANGIAGALIFDATGAVNHAGARIRRPDAEGEHIVSPGPIPFSRVDYVTGALFAIRRHAWQNIGPFDEGFYPGYYEESDYCYRARRHGIETIVVLGAQATHLLTGDAWQREPLRHAVDQRRSRYRFVVKHFDAVEVIAFLLAEVNAIAQLNEMDPLLARALAARDTLRALADIIARRHSEVGLDTPAPLQAQLRIGFRAIWRAAFAQAQTLSRVASGELRPISTNEQDADDSFAPPPIDPGGAPQRGLAARLRRLVAPRRYAAQLVRLEGRIAEQRSQSLRQQAELNGLRDRQAALIAELSGRSHALAIAGAEIAQRLRLLELLADHDDF